jgi:hypothetical protein
MIFKDLNHFKIISEIILEKRIFIKNVADASMTSATLG